MTIPDLPAGQTRRNLKIADKTRLVDAVQRTQVLANAQSRQQITEELAIEFGTIFNPPASGAANFDTVAIINACLKVGGVHQLVDLLKLFGGETSDWVDLRTLVVDLLPPREVEESQRARLEQLLSNAPPDALSHVIADPSLKPHLPFDTGHPDDNVEVYRRLEEISGPSGQRARLVYLEFIAHQLDAQEAVELHRLIDSMSEDLGGKLAIGSYCETLFQNVTSAASEQAVEQEDGNVSAHGESIPGEDVNAAATSAPRTEVRPVARPSVWGGVPPRNIRFTGRDHLLDAINRTLDEHIETALVSQTLHGLGGVGKTQVAVEFAYRFQHRYDLVWFIHADDDRSVRRGLVSLARRLEIPHSDGAVEDTIENVLDALGRTERRERWLLIYDNADDPSSLRGYLPAGPGHVIITSRNRDWTAELNAVEVDVFSPEECSQLLTARWPELTDEEAVQLAEQLGRLPLALEQAAAVHQQTGMQLAEYLRILKTQPTALLKEGAPAGYPASVALTMRLAYERLQERSPAAAQLLELCVFLGPHSIAVPMLMRGRGAQLPEPLVFVIRDDAGLRMAVRDLGRFALAQIDPGRDLIRIHTLIAAILRDGLESEEKATNEGNAHALLGLANPRGPDDPANWRQHAQIGPHVIPSGLLYSVNSDARQVVLDQMRYLLAIGDYAESKKLAEQAVDTWKGSLGVNDDMTLLASRHLANALRALGDYPAARALNQDVLERMRATFSADHQYTLATAMNVAADLRLLGEFEQARLLDEENYARYHRVIGDDDLTTWRQAHNLAVDYRLLGNFKKAWELDDKTAHRLDEILGEDNPFSLYSYASLVRDLYGLGQYQKALALQRDKLRLHEKRLAPHHNELMFAKRNLAILWRRTGNYSRALDQALSNHEICRKTYGSKHEHTLASMISVCNALRVVGDVDASFRIGSEALAGYEQAFGVNHPFTFACALNLAVVLRALKRNGEARTLNDRALEGLKRQLGDDHPFTLCAAINRTNDLSRIGKIEEALELSEATLSRSKRARGEDHPNTLSCAANLALDLEAVGEETRAVQLRRDTLARMRDRLGREHPEIISFGMDVRAEADVELPPT